MLALPTTVSRLIMKKEKKKWQTKCMMHFLIFDKNIEHWWSWLYDFITQKDFWTIKEIKFVEKINKSTKLLAVIIK